MNSKTMIVLGVIMIGLLALVMFGKPGTDPTSGTKDKLMDVEADDVTSVSIDRAIGSRPGESPSPSGSGSASPSAAPSNGPRKRETLDFEKMDGRWVLKPAGYRVADTDANNLITTIIDMRENETVDEPNDAGYGFTDPDAIIDMKTRNDSHRIVLGRNTVTDQGYYLKFDNQSKVIVSGLGLQALVSRSPEAWRDKSALTMDTADVTKWSLVRNNQTIAAEKKDDGHWYITQPLAATGDDTAVSNVVYQVKNARITRFPTGIKPDNAVLKPTMTFSVWGKDDKTPDTITIGSMDPKTQAWYATRSPLGEVIEIPDKDLAPLRVSVDSLEDKHVASFDLTALNDLVLTVGKEEIDAKKNGFEYTITRPAGMRDDLKKMSSVVEQAHDLLWTRKLTGSAATADLGFSSPPASIVLHNDKGTVLDTLQFGKSAGKNQVYVRVAEHPDVAYVTSDNIMGVLQGGGQVTDGGTVSGAIEHGLQRSAGLCRAARVWRLGDFRLSAGFRLSGRRQVALTQARCWPWWMVAAAAALLSGCHGARTAAVVPPPTPLPLPSVRPGPARYQSRDESVDRLVQLGKPHLNLPAAAHVVRTDVTTVSPAGLRGLEVRLESVQASSDNPDVIAVVPADIDLQRPIGLHLTPAGGLARVNWPASWAAAGLEESDYDLFLEMLCPPRAPDATLTVTQPHVERFLGRRVAWQTQATWRTLDNQGGVVALHYEAVGHTAGGERIASGVFHYDAVHDRLLDARLSERTHLRLQWSKHLLLDDTVIRTITHQLQP